MRIAHTSDSEKNDHANADSLATHDVHMRSMLLFSSSYQRTHVDNLMKKYEIRESAKMQISLSSSSTLAKYDEEIDQQRMHEYRQKFEFNLLLSDDDQIRYS
jgi:hypothetical protein